MKRNALQSAATLLLVGSVSTSNAQLRLSTAAGDDPRMQDSGQNTLISEHFVSKSDLQPAKTSLAGFCPTLSQRDVWDDTMWVEFSQTLSSCDSNGNSVTTEGRINLGEDWNPSYRWLRTYDQNNSITEWIHQSHNGTEWVNTRRDINTYHSSGLVEVLLDQVWDGGSWVDEDRRTYDYNNDGLRIGSLDEDWDGSHWVPVERTTSEVIDATTGTELTEEWDGAAWQPTELATSEMTDAQNYTITLQEWDGAQWVNTRRLTSTDADQTEESWDGTQWVFVTRQELTYDGQNRLTELVEQEWDGSAWVNDYRAVYIFDATSGKRTEFRLDSWDGSAWANDHQQLYTYDPDGNQTEDLTREWDGTEWVNLQRLTTTWQEVGGVGIDDERAFADGFRLLQNYPNPASSTSKIGFDIPRSTEISLTAFDLLGREVKVFFKGTVAAGTHELEVDVHMMPAGTYFYRLQSSDTSVTRRMLVIN